MQREFEILEALSFFGFAGYDGALRLWSTTTWEKAGEVPCKREDEGYFRRMNDWLHRDGGKVQLLETASCGWWRNWNWTPGCQWMAFSPDGSMLAVGAADKRCASFCCKKGCVLSFPAVHIEEKHCK